MNKVILMGRLTRDPDARYSQGADPTAVVRYSIAVDRRFKRDGEPTADFFNCVAFGKSGEFAEKYFRKGQRVLVEGVLRNNSWEKDGQKHSATDVIVEQQYFADSKGAGGAGGYDYTQNPPTGYGNRQGDGGAGAGGFSNGGGGGGFIADNDASGASSGGFMPIDESLDDEDLPF